MWNMDYGIWTMEYGLRYGERGMGNIEWGTGIGNGEWERAKKKIENGKWRVVNKEKE